jgi:hypothetical protein
VDRCLTTRTAITEVTLASNSCYEIRAPTLTSATLEAEHAPGSRKTAQISATHEQYGAPTGVVEAVIVASYRYLTATHRSQRNRLAVHDVPCVSLVSLHNRVTDLLSFS